MLELANKYFNLFDIQQLAQSIGLSVMLRSRAPNTWEETLEKSAYSPFFYSNSSIEFQSAFQRSCGAVVEDISLIIYWNNTPMAIWPLSVIFQDGKYGFNSHGLPVSRPLFVGACPTATRKKISKLCLGLADTVAQLLGLASWCSTDYFEDSLSMSEWHLQAMSRGAQCKVLHNAFVDLRMDLVEIKSAFRKSYKSLITSGLKTWKVSIQDCADENNWEHFRNLHFQVTGRRTRSKETWDLHHQDIIQGNGLLVALINDKNEMDGAGFFNFTKDESFYAVAAYKRELFDKPLGHVVQFTAISELKKRGVRWHRLGYRPYKTDIPEPTPKELSIADFKQGFATHMFPQYKFTHLVDSQG